MRIERKTNTRIIRNLSIHGKSHKKSAKSFQIRAIEDRNRFIRMRLSLEAIDYIKKQITMALKNNVIQQDDVFIAKAGIISTGVEVARKYGENKITRGSIVKGWGLSRFGQCVPASCVYSTVVSRKNNFGLSTPSFNDLIDL